MLMKWIYTCICLFTMNFLVAQNKIDHSINASSKSSAGHLYTVGEITVQFEDNNIRSGFVSISTQKHIITSIKEPNNNLKILFYPNPVHDLLNIQINSELKGFINYRITDITGKTMRNDRQHSMSNRMTFFTKNWPSGTYILQILDDTEQLLGSYQIIKL